MTYTEFTIYGDVNVSVKITDLGDGSFRFDVSVITEGEDYTGQIGELNGVYFNLPDATSTFDYGDLTISGGLDYKLKEDGVSNLGGGINMNGEALKANGGGWDAGVVIDRTGLAGTDGALNGSFVLSDPTGTLSLDDFTTESPDQYFGVRLTSVGDPDGARTGSLKLGGLPSGEIIDEQPEAPVNVANADSMRVFETESFNVDGFDFLDDLQTSILENDTSGGAPYLGSVTAVDGGDVGQIVMGSNGGLMIIYPDGSVDFSANGEFDFLNDFETAETQFVYEIDGSATATVTVLVDGLGGGGLEEGGLIG